MSPPPRILVAPESDKSGGVQLVKLAMLAGIGLDDAQQLVSEVACRYDANRKWLAFEVVVFAPRQNIKTEWAIARILAGLTVFREDLIVYSAHQARTTAKTFTRLKRAIDQCPELGARIKRVSNRLGAEVIELTNGRTLECVARSTGSGRGYTGDLIILDESHELDQEQLASLLPMLSTRPNPQVCYLLSQGNEKSTHLGGLRHRALNGAGAVAWLEWSLAEGDRIDDREVWAKCNPAYPARISMQYLEREFEALGPVAFARERLGKSSWPQDETGYFAVISREAWESCEDHTDQVTGPVSLGVSVSSDGRSAAIVAAGKGHGSLPVLDVIEHRPGEGAGWVGPRLSALVRTHRVAAVCWDDGSMAGPLGLPSFIGEAVPVMPKPGELAGACGSLFYAADQRLFHHRGDIRLGLAVGAAKVRPSRSSWYWDERAYGSELLQAATWALHAHEYEGEGIVPGAWLVGELTPEQELYERLRAQTLNVQPSVAAMVARSGMTLDPYGPF